MQIKRRYRQRNGRPKALDSLLQRVRRHTIMSGRHWHSTAHTISWRGRQFDPRRVLYARFRQLELKQLNGYRLIVGCDDRHCIRPSHIAGMRPTVKRFDRRDANAVWKAQHTGKCSLCGDRLYKYVRLTRRVRVRDKRRVSGWTKRRARRLSICWLRNRCAAHLYVNEPTASASERSRGDQP